MEYAAAKSCALPNWTAATYNIVYCVRMAMMLARTLPAALAFTLGCSLAHADIYTWIDKSGTINVSNLPPPDGVRVTKVMHESPKKVASSDSGGDPASPDVQALSDRVRQLEQEVDLARRQPPPPPPPYPVAPYPAVQAPPPVVQYPSVQYQVVEMPPMQQYGGYGPSGGNGWNAGCDPSWWTADCVGWWAPGFYPSTIVVVNAPGFRRPFLHNGQFPPHGGRFPMQKTGQAPNTRMHRG